jgi:hypothetical protein
MSQESDYNKSYRAIANVLGAPVDGGTQVVAFTGTADDITLTPGKVYRLVATEACHVIFTSGGSADATTSDCYLVAELPDFFSTIPGGFSRLSVISAGTNGNLYVSELG